MQQLTMVEGDCEGNDQDYALKLKRRKIQQTPSHISKVVATNNFKILTPWSWGIQNGL
jgi:hypothetical protein